MLYSPPALLCPEKRMNLQIRPATIVDVPLLVLLINAASRGLSIHILASLAPPGVDPWTFARDFVCDDDTPLSWRKAWMAEVSAEPVGFVLPIRLPDVPEEGDHTPMSPVLQPLDELEAEAHGTGHVYLMAVSEEMRGQGVGSALLQFAERWRGPRGMSLTVADANEGARRLYERNGYVEAGRRRMVKEGWQGTGTDWILMRKP
jgi:ribosomal protein S18 acetylase RimI-like enzyme